MRLVVRCLSIMGAGLLLCASHCDPEPRDFDSGFAGVPGIGLGGSGGVGGYGGTGPAVSERTALCTKACTTLVECFLQSRNTSLCELTCEGTFPGNERCTRCVAEAEGCDRASICQDYCVPDACLLDEDCPDGSACSERDGGDASWGLCVLAECTTDEACGEGRYCTGSSFGSYCRDIECQVDGDCPDKSATCDQHVCLLPECEVDAHCRPDLACSEQRCALMACATDEECRAGAVCDEGYCALSECDADADCLPEDSCEGHRCRDRKCGNAGDCPAGMLCDVVCYLPECYHPEDCTELYGPGFTCAVDHCERDFGCELSAECLRDEACVDGACQRIWTCETDGDCRSYANEVCRDGGCDRDFSCTADADCLVYELCLQGLCY